MNVIMVPYRHQNKKAFLVDRISSHRHALCALDIMAELLTQTLAQSGSTSTGQTHNLLPPPVREAGLLHFLVKMEISHTALLQAG